ncbi:uncharacterized protein LOC116295261 [Actinia tenebrosa]|uniref:Uncharacterized protein LOC116295261 n=1 Tax=Actinia tenebrosa TaxID=6105 RepID=A0A6P8HUG4_ACTTE|nr:uncharacterized protein LOC116295261 [Actinia tenebrosa]
MGCLTGTGRFVFFVALITQAVMFAQYPSIYFENSLYNCLILLVLPTLLAWFAVLTCCHGNEQLQNMWFVWGVYVLTLLIPMVGIIYGRLRESLDSNQFFGPNILLMTTCGSPAIALLLLTTAKGTATHEENIELFTQLCGNVVLDLFDYIEILDILLSQNENFHLSSALQVCIVVFVCISLVLSTLEMAEMKCETASYVNEIVIRKKTYLLRLILQMFLVNIALLVIRLIVWFKYKHNASIFIAKNVIIIMMSIIGLVRFFAQ